MKIDAINWLVETLKEHGIIVSPMIIGAIILIAFFVVVLLCAIGVLDPNTDNMFVDFLHRFFPMFDNLPLEDIANNT